VLKIASVFILSLSASLTMAATTVTEPQKPNQEIKKPDSVKPVNTFSVEQKLSDLDQLVAVLKSGYGPLKYKKDKLNIDVDVLRAVYANEISQTQNTGEFYYSLLRFIAEFRDGHFRANIPTDTIATVPFETDLIEGKVLIDKINRELLPESTFSFQRGDEILAVNNVEIAAVLDDLQKYRGLGNPASERRMAAFSVTSRNGRRMPVPQGEVTFKIRRGTSQVVDEAKLTWKVTGTFFDEVTENPLAARLRRLSAEAHAPGSNYDELSIRAIVEDARHPEFERWFSCSGDTRTEIPKDATIIMKKPFMAYYHPTAKGNIGYLRIPHYSPEDGNFALRFSQYEYAVSVLEENTVGLVIDQDHNCGGSVGYLHQLVSLFAESTFTPVQFRLLANKSEYLRYRNWATSPLSENTLSRKNAERVMKLINDSWLAGEFMTPMTAIDGNNSWLPNPVRYTKPVLILIDEMSGSGGDAFPALMQGIGRAKLLGSRTMGLGGHVVAQPALFYSQIVPEMTKSLFYRPDGTEIENNGAEPDIPYTPTRDDFLYKYRGYREFYVTQLLEMLK